MAEALPAPRMPAVCWTGILQASGAAPTCALHLCEIGLPLSCPGDVTGEC